MVEQFLRVVHTYDIAAARNRPDYFFNMGYSIVALKYKRYCLSMRHLTNKVAKQEAGYFFLG